MAALQAGADLLVGEHDFASFGQPTAGEPKAMGRGPEATGLGPEATGRGPETTGRGSTVRRIFRADWRQDGSSFTFDVIGNAFLRGMVRSMVGTLLQVGSGSWPVEQVAAILRARDRSLAAPPAPACGLCLMHVEYELEPRTEE